MDIRNIAPGKEIPVVPLPPSDGMMDNTYQIIFNSVLWMVVVVFVVMAWRYYRKEGSVLPLLFLIGGGLCMFLEPFLDVVGLVWFYREGQWVLFEFFGRPMPTFLLPTYIFYVGGQAFYTYCRLEKGETTKGIWKLYGIYFIVNLFLEEPPLHMGLYTYYGAQPLRPILLPLWWPLINAAMPIVIAAVVHRLKPVLTGWKTLLVIPIIPMCDALANAAVGWPIWSALNTTDSLLITHLAALVSIGLGMILVWTLTLACGTDSPLRVRLN